MNYLFKDDAVMLSGTDLPAGWGHILATEKAFSVLSVFGQGYTIDREPDLFQHAGPNRYVYLRDEDGHVFSPSFVPVCRGLDEYRVTLHPESLTFHAAASNGLATTTRVTVDPATGSESWEMEILNSSARDRKLEVVVLVPFLSRRGFGAHCWFDSGACAVINHVTPHFLTTEERAQTLHLKPFSALVLDRPPQDYTTSLGDILPLPETASNPPFLDESRWTNRESWGGQSCGAVRFSIPLAAGATHSVRFALAAAAEVGDLAAIRKRMDAGAAFVSAHAEWETWDAGVRVDLPDVELARYINTFAKHQIRMNCVTARWSQAPATRNWVQDWQGASYLVPAQSAEAFRAALKAQRADGFIPQGFKTSAFGAIVHLLGRDFRDSPVWFPSAILTLLENTGDAGFLQEVLPYSDGGEATVIDHLFNGLKFLANRRGSHGLILFGEGDWNDQLSNAGCQGRGESSWLSFAFVAACHEFAELCVWAGTPDLAAAPNQWADELTAALNLHAWDGGWYVRGFTDDGQPFGNAAAAEGRIYLETQAFALLARAVPDERIPVLLDSIESELLTDFGPRLLNPPYTKWNEAIGRITVDMPGFKENGSVYCHAAMFYAAALLKAGRIAEGCAQLSAILPTNPSHPVEVSGQNPAYIPNSYIAPEVPPGNGRGSNHNWTGTAAWLLLIAIRDVLGVRGTPEGLTIVPNLPPHWPEAGITMPFRGAQISLRITRGPARSLHVNGRPTLPDANIPVVPGENYFLQLILPPA